MIRAMRFLAVSLVIVLAAGGAAADSKKELQEDICYAWQHANAGKTREYREDIDRFRAGSFFFHQGKTDTPDRSLLGPEWLHVQQLCERYKKRFGSWPEKCCLGAKIIAEGQFADRPSPLRPGP
jgi:hypothetical protein